MLFKFAKMAVVLFVLLLWGCVSDLSLSDLTPVPAPRVGSYPDKTDASEITLFGTKGAGTDVIINMREVATLDDKRFWSATFPLLQGVNAFTLFSMDEDGRESGQVLVSIEREVVPPSAVSFDPAIAESVSVSPVIITGQKSAGCALYVNDRKVVPADDDTTFTFRYSLSSGDNTISVFQEDFLGKRGESVSVNIVFDSTALAPPLLLKPADSADIDDGRFSWSAVSLGIKYVIEVSARPDFRELIPDFPVDVTGADFVLTGNLSPGAYYWRVGSVLGESVFFSTARKFTVGIVENDVNADGFSDILAGAPFEKTDEGLAGAAYLYLGKEFMNPNPSWRFSGETHNDRFGLSTSWVGDVNADGFSDFVIGASEFVAYERDFGSIPTESDPGLVYYEDSGRAYLFFGGDSVGDLPDLVITGVAGDNLGYVVTGVGDVNADGFSDFALSAPGGNRKDEEDIGRVFIYYGGNDIDNMYDIVLSGELLEDAFGFSVSGAGDMDGDGYADIIVGAPGSDVSGVNSGRAYVYFGSPYGVRDDILFINGSAAGDEMGAGVSGVGDLNGDGYGDIAITALRRQGLDDFGMVFVYFGGVKPDSLADAALVGQSELDMFGLHVAGAGDINNDGLDDIMVGAPYNESTGLKTGQAYIYFGGEEIDPQPSLIFSGRGLLELYGSSGGKAGDVNGDGFADIIIGAPYNEQVGEDSGRMELFLGRPEFPVIANVHFFAFSSGSLFGYSIN